MYKMGCKADAILPTFAIEKARRSRCFEKFKQRGWCAAQQIYQTWQLQNISRGDLTRRAWRYKQQDKPCKQMVGTAIHWTKNPKNPKVEDWGSHWPRTKILGISHLLNLKIVCSTCKAEPVMSRLSLRQVEAVSTPKSNTFWSQSSWTGIYFHGLWRCSVTHPWSLNSLLRLLLSDSVGLLSLSTPLGTADSLSPPVALLWFLLWTLLSWLVYLTTLPIEQDGYIVKAAPYHLSYLSLIHLECELL